MNGKNMEKQNNKNLLIDRIIKAAQESPEFRENLISNPKNIFEMQSQFKLPEDFEIVVHEDTPNKLNIVLPRTSEELSDIELSAVSGGVCWDNCVNNSCH